jgi:D-lactate dehydrogenase (cytochrome)
MFFNHYICRGHEPDIVVYAQSTDHVSQIVKYCASKRLPVIPFGTGTGLEGKYKLDSTYFT